MTARECLQILRDIKDVAFATVDEKGLPHVRIIDVMLVKEEKLYFCTARGKDFYRQLTETHHTEITGLNREYQMVRISGTVNRLTDQKKWIDRIFEANPSMNDIYPGESRYILEPFCMEEGQIEFFDLGKSPIYRESFAIGGAEVPQKAYHGCSSGRSSLPCTHCDRCVPRTSGRDDPHSHKAYDRTVCAWRNAEDTDRTGYGPKCRADPGSWRRNIQYPACYGKRRI